MQMLLNKINISLFLIIVVIFLLITNHYEEFFFLFLSSGIHELFHVLMAKLFKLKINKINISIIGFSCEIENVEYVDLYKQILIYLAGPFSFFFSHLIIYLLFNLNLITYEQFIIYSVNNFTLNLFNLLPLYPLDGGRIIDCLFKNALDVKKALFIRRVSSIIILIPVSIILLINNQFILFVFIWIMITSYILSYRNEYVEYLEDRYQRNIDYKDYVNIEESFYHFKNNYYVYNKRIIDEKRFIELLLIKKSYQKSKKW